MTHSLANSETDLAFPVNHESLDAPAPAPGTEPIEHSSDTTGLDNGEVSCYRNGYSVDYKPSTRQMGCAILPESEPLLLSSMQLNTNVGELMGVQDSENTTKASESFESNAGGNYINPRLRIYSPFTNICLSIRIIRNVFVQTDLVRQTLCASIAFGYYESQSTESLSSPWCESCTWSATQFRCPYVFVIVSPGRIGTSRI